MSGRLVSAVLESTLPHRLKTIAAVLASYGRDDGSAIRPSLHTIAKRWSRSERRAQAALADLLDLGVLVIVRPHGPHRPTEYRIDLERLRLNNFRLIGQDLGRSETLISTEFSTGRGSKTQGFFEFSTVSTGVHRTIRAGKPDASVTRSVHDPNRYQYSRARETRTKASARR